MSGSETFDGVREHGKALNLPRPRPPYWSPEGSENPARPSGLPYPRAGTSNGEDEMKVEYSANNSGGYWWLNDEHWKALADAGWKVDFGGKQFCHSSYKPMPNPVCTTKEECHGHIRFATYDEAVAAGGDARFLGAIAHHATKEFPTLRDAIVEWEKVTGLDSTDEGCNCCGPPHSFQDLDGYEYVSGEDIVPVLYGDDAPKTLREAAERMKR